MLADGHTEGHLEVKMVAFASEISQKTDIMVSVQGCAWP